MSIEGSEGLREYNASDVHRFLNNSFGIPISNDDSPTPVSWEVSGVRVIVDESLGVVDVYGLDPVQRVYHPGDVKSGIKIPRNFYSLFLLKAEIGWYCALAEGGQSMNCRIPLADFEAQCE